MEIEERERLRLAIRAKDRARRERWGRNRPRRVGGSFPRSKASVADPRLVRPGLSAEPNR